MDEMEGKFLVRLARRTISSYLEQGEIIEPPKEPDVELNEKRGVFVTLYTYPERQLRGCIGLPEPVTPLGKAIINAAILSATKDPRFSPLTVDELVNITIEVTVLTTPKPLDANTYLDCLDKIEIGRHGLIIENETCRGLLLPQVPVEQGWRKEEYLTGLCLKAGLPGDAWTSETTKLYTFEGTVFSELNPDGAVEKKYLY
jgi:uncharacterized protein (TIGR00296 family)